MASSSGPRSLGPAPGDVLLVGRVSEQCWKLGAPGRPDQTGYKGTHSPEMTISPLTKWMSPSVKRVDRWAIPLLRTVSKSPRTVPPLLLSKWRFNFNLEGANHFQFRNWRNKDYLRLDYKRGGLWEGTRDPNLQVVCLSHLPQRWRLYPMTRQEQECSGKTNSGSFSETPDLCREISAPVEQGCIK